ncbi:hypothetical protein SERP0913 [Staphylococcus epidermidis RP62A]|uniref:Uncharacterized protein n=1 Tax=Staphylococcus epidermidis (strain ATCC 35984 / DSM 28319 / BCRC 17069 / CCUG 31568 / BM 3577 / RP62A) TaxID=176279 RepID=Q5HPJ8_STAEQ|nr:hypothetical protein SERP0913 [Staphylococcus epidermidis RP62A]EES58361.1 hypothetical protein HMPREF0789_1057 [Staphylococcus epidermidis BCM-HMP0060]
MVSNLLDFKIEFNNIFGFVMIIIGVLIVIIQECLEITERI